MVRRLMVLVIAVALVVPAFGADETPLQVGKADTIRTVLASHAGERVTLKLESGDEMTGKVGTVGDHVVHLSELSGKEFYDAVVDLDQVAAVILRVRGK